MTFIANPDAATPAPTVEDVVDADGWYPAVTISAFRASARIGTTVTELRVRDALIGGIIGTMTGLAAWREAQEDAGATSLATTRQRNGKLWPSIAGDSQAEILWRRAVYAFAAADLVETHSDISATDGAQVRRGEGGRDYREARAASADELRRDATIAVRDLVGQGRAKVSLI